MLPTLGATLTVRCKSTCNCLATLIVAGCVYSSLILWQLPTSDLSCLRWVWVLYTYSSAPLGYSSPPPLPGWCCRQAGGIFQFRFLNRICPVRGRKCHFRHKVRLPAARCKDRTGDFNAGCSFNIKISGSGDFGVCCPSHINPNFTV